MKSTIRLIAAMLLGIASSGSLKAGNVTFNFDIDPGTDPLLAGAIIVGNHNYTGTFGPQIWSSGAGVAIDGNPATGGYLSISDGTNGNNGLVFVFPDVDNGLPLNGFQIDLDLRVGNGNLGRPADGFSISFARAGDIALVNATNNTLGGFAGGDGSVAAAAATGGSVDVENGTKTGVAVVFDAWQGNYLPDTLPYSSPPAGVGSSAATDREGIAVRLDDRTLAQIDLILNRNEKDCVPTTQTTLANNGTGLSLQTGTNAFVVSGTGCARVYGAADATGSYTNLVWQHLMVRLTNNPVASPCTPPSYNLSVTWKGVTVVNTNLASFSPYNGRLVLAGRTGGNNQNVHADNIKLFTRPVTNVFLGSINGLLNGFTFTLLDNVNAAPPATFSGLVQVLLDNTNDVTAQTVVNYTAPTTVGTFQQVTRFAPGSTHIAQVCWKDSNNATNSTALSFVVPLWIQMPTNLALPLASVDTSKPGVRTHSHQALQNNPNQMWWTEHQLVGRKGPSVAAPPSLPSESDGSQTFQVWDGPMDFANVGAGVAAVQRGFFNSVASGDNDLNLFGFGIGTPYPANPQFDFYQNSAVEFFGYIYFPTSGVYNMVMGSDDGFQLSVSQNPLDRMGQVLWFLNGSRVPTATSPPGVAPNVNDVRPVVVDQAGVYPFRLVYENGGGAAALEWYTTPPITTAPIANFNSWLVNDTNNPTGGNGVAMVKIYRALLGGNNVGPYVKSADPVRGDPDVVFYSPVIIELADGTGSKTINDGTVALTVDGAPLAFTASRSGGTLKLSQSSVPNWAGGNHTNVVTFSDNLGTNYTYTWSWTVLGGASGVARADTTNTVDSFYAVPASLGVTLGQLDATKPGFRIRSYQTPQENPTQVSFYEEQFQGMHGMNLANQSGTNGPGFFTWGDGFTPSGGPGVLDLRTAFTGSSGDVLGGGAGGKFAYDVLGITTLGNFGIGALSGFAYPDNDRLSGANRAENSSLEVSTWLYFPAAGTYIMHFNSDDGLKLSMPYGSLQNKLGFVVFEDNVGRGMVNAGGVETGGSYAKISIPAPGGYPFRLLWFNAGTDGGLEWSIFQQLSDGTVHRVAINDANIAGSIKAYQTLTAGDVNAPYVSYANPVYNSGDVMSYQPLVVDLKDGPAPKTVNSGTINFRVDGVLQAPVVTTPAAGTTHIVVNGTWFAGLHTNILTFSDNNGGTYSNRWVFNVPSQSLFYSAIPVPLSNRVDVSALDTSKPGFRVKSYQTTAGNPNTIIWTEEQFEGLKGPNIAAPAPNGQYYEFNGPVDFAGNINFNGNAQSGEHRYNLAFSNFFGITINGGAPNENNCSLMFGGWMVFPQAGNYLMTVNSDDGFKVTSPSGGNPFSQAGTFLGQVAAGRGNNSGYNANPFALGGSVSPVLFRIPQAGAYPIRMVWENGGGGLNVEWTMWQSYTNGDITRALVGDTNAIGAVQIYQSLLVDEPYVVSVFPSPGPGLVGPELTLIPGTGSTNIAGGVQDLTIQLQDGLNRTVNTNTITLTFRGVNQPIIITTNGAGVTTILRSAQDPQFWPSGAYGPLTLTYQDSTGNVLSQTWQLATAFWGTLNNSLSLAQIDTSKQGFAARPYQVDGKAQNTAGSPGIPNRIHVAEQILAGIWGPNVALNSGFNDRPFIDLIGTGRTNGVINLNGLGMGAGGDFQPGAGFGETIFPGIPGAVQFPAINQNSNCNFAIEFLSYVEFPTNGTYILGVASDDGFRLTRGFNPPANKGALVVNSPAGLAGPKPTVQNTFLTSLSLTSAITGNLVLPNGISFLQGSSTNGEGCVITDPPGTLAGKIAIMYRSFYCSYLQQVSNAAAAGAIAVVLIQNRTNIQDGFFPQEPGVNPPVQPIPAVQIEKPDGDALVAALAGGPVNVTLTPMDYLINPPPGTAGPLGQADQGKGANDILFPVVVQQSGVYPLRLVYWQGGGGASCEFFSVNGTNRTLINDLTATNGPGPGGAGLRAFFPSMNITATYNGSQVTLTYSGTLQSAPVVTGPYTNVPGATSPYTFTPTPPMQFFRTQLQN